MECTPYSSPGHTATERNQTYGPAADSVHECGRTSVVGTARLQATAIKADGRLGVQLLQEGKLWLSF